MDKNLFDYRSYKPYLAHRLDAEGARSGRRAAFAQTLGCQSSFVSQVVRGDLHLSLEQAFRANNFLAHTEDQAHFFMLLVQKDRAGSVELKRYHQKQIDALVKERKQIKKRLSHTEELSQDHMARYYSRWEYSTLHMALAVPRLRTASALAHAFHLSLKRVEEVLTFLVQSGLADHAGGDYRIGHVHLHLGADSPFIDQHHTNWRLEALRRLQTGDESLHYSAVYTLSREDYQKLRENLLRAVQNGLEIIRPSPEEIVVCQMIDLIPLTE